MGNHNRSPIVAAVLAQLGGDTVEIRSAGLREKHVGKGAHTNMIRAAAESGYDNEDHRAVQVPLRMLQWADSVLAMDRSVLGELHELSDETSAAKLRLYLDGEDVHDPWAGRLPGVHRMREGHRGRCPPPSAVDALLLGGDDGQQDVHQPVGGIGPTV
ncbi:hypothetical protein [Streptomyces mirabilis]|uniref:arsenate reductase/protein-tyrosine-phosphatase family protein n=1 Tax=Streptomyces mirabilis TaxID=68239 RepID=UPI00332BB51D